jgi:hypothetical protein
MGAEVRSCLTCGKTIRGRSDKKFCDDYCRNNYNNQLKADDNNYVRNINNALRKNRRILLDLLPEGDELVKTTREKLVTAGFRFKYFTHTYTNKKGSTYHFCYDYGYLPLDGDIFLIVKRKEEM